ncbi:MAG TPA: ABC-2 family transporter protein [Bacillota bacterium]|nr:ABC-2 family transporter protein [Bacillota bacterium]
MKRYLMLTRSVLLSGVNHRVHFIAMSLGNIIYVFLIYYLWKSIYTNSSQLNGLSFGQAFVYLAMGSSLFWLFTTWVEYDMAQGIVNGTIVKHLLLPLDLQLHYFFNALGYITNNLLLILFPALMMLSLLFKASVPIGWNLIWFVLSVAFSFVITFHIDYIIGLLSFYTESIWGISIIKEVIVTTFSGAVVPLQFFPGVMRSIVEWLPFQTIYHTPLMLLITPQPSFTKVAVMFLNQLFWMLVCVGLAKFIYNRAIRKITINGG